MKNLTLLFALISISVFAQYPNCYMPNGDKCPTNLNKGKTKADVDKNFELYGRTFSDNIKINDRYVSLVYKSLSKDLLYVDAPKGIILTKEKIDELSQNIDESFYWKKPYSGMVYDIKYMIKHRILDSKFVIDNLGSPSQSGESYRNNKSLLYLDYKSYGFKLWFLNDICIAIDENF